MRLETAFTGDLKKIIALEEKNAKAAVKKGVVETSLYTKNALRKQVTRAGFGQKVAKSWRSKVYPGKNKTSLNSAGLVESKAPNIIRAFSEGKVIKSKTIGKWLAIPTRHAPKTTQFDKRISPSNWPEHKYGELKYVFNKKGMSFAYVTGGWSVKKNGKLGKRYENGGLTKKGKYRKGIATVVMFIMVRQTRPKKLFNIDSVVSRTGERLARNVIKHWEDGSG